MRPKPEKHSPETAEEKFASMPSKTVEFSFLFYPMNVVKSFAFTIFSNRLLAKRKDENCSFL